MEVNLTCILLPTDVVGKKKVSESNIISFYLHKVDENYCICLKN